jgi:PAS domain S-box-containing protein
MTPSTNSDATAPSRATSDSSLPNASEAQQWLAAIVESSDDAIIGKSLDGMITSWNKGAERVFGYTPAEAIGKPISMLAWPGNEDDMKHLLERIRNKQHVEHYETKRRRKDGQHVLISLTLSPILNADGQIVGISKIARDITEIKVAEKALLDNNVLLEKARADVLAEQRFRDLIENAPDAIFQVDRSGTILLTNRTAETMLGYTRAELMGQSIDLLVPDAVRGTHAKHRASYLHAPAIRPMGTGLDLRARRKDGVEIPVEISLSPNPTGSGTSVTAVVRDISERRQAEEEVRTLQERYLAELEARSQDADRANRLKSEFLASMSHELRTPLHTIIGFSELLAEEFEGPLNDSQKRYLSHIHRDSEHLLELINEILDLSKIEAGSLSLRPESIHLANAVADAVSSVQPRAALKGIALEDRNSFPGKVVADPLRLKEILYNLLGNALKFTPEGGRVWIEASAQDRKFVQITVADTGIGIPPEEQTNVFEKFYQVGQSASGIREGTGLGLAICKRLVEMQGGALWLESEPGRGSKFHFTLPQGV